MRRLVNVRVVTGASSDRIEKLSDDSYKIWTTKKPIKGRANQAVIEALSDELKVAKSLIGLKSGHRSRDKVLEVLA